MTRLFNLKSYSLIVSTLVFALFLLFFDFGKSGSRIVDAIISFGHLPLFGVVALTAFWFLGQGKRSLKDRSLYFKAWTIVFFFGVATECVQALIPYRHFRLGDIYTDALGAAVFLMFTYSYQNKAAHRRVIIMRNVLLVLVMIRAYPILTLLIDTWKMEKDFPVLGSFESSLEMSRYSGQDGIQDRIRLHATEGIYSLKSQLNAGLYPGISMNYLHNDWKGYTTLTFDVFLDGTTPLELTVRINDRMHNDEYLDRFNKIFQVIPGINHISIRLDEVKTAPRGRVMDMADIVKISVFAYKLKGPRTVYFDNFRLVGRS